MNALFSELQRRLERLTSLQAAVVLFIVGLLCYSNAIFHPFVHDDIVFIQYNPHIADFKISNIFSQTSQWDDAAPMVNQYYRPLLEFLNRMLYQFFGLNPHGYHFFNILVHVANGLLIYELLVLTWRTKKIFAFFTAVIFLVHPIQTESVACIAGISNLFYTFLCLLVFHLYVHAARSAAAGRSRFLYGLSLVVYYFAMLAKEQSIVLVPCLVLYELLLKPEGVVRGLKAQWKKIFGYVVVVAVYFVLRLFLFGQMLSPVFDNWLEFKLRMLSIPGTIFMYIRLLVWPEGLHYYRTTNTLDPYAGPMTLFLAVLVLMVLIIKSAGRPYRNRMLLGLGLFFVALGPTLNIVPLINEYSQLLTSEHFLYLPLLGFIIFFFSLLECVIQSWPKEKMFRVGLAAMLVLTPVYMVMTIKQNRYWADEETLFKRTIQFQPRFGRARFLLASVYYRMGEYEKAVEQFLIGGKIMTGYIHDGMPKPVKDFYLRFQRDANRGAAESYMQLGDWENAGRYYENAVKVNLPDAGLYTYYGLYHLRVDDVDGAITYFKKALAMNENDLMTANSLGLCYKEKGDWDEAEKYFRIVAEKDPHSESAQSNLKSFLKEKSEHVH